MRTKEQFIEGLRKMRNNIYFNGSKINRVDEVQINCINTIGLTFDEAEKPENADLMTSCLELVDQPLGEGASTEHYTLCRCGGSKNKPFCDGTHWHIGFKDEKN